MKTKEPEERFVISSSEMIHREGCPHVRHYVDGRRWTEHGPWSETHQNGYWLDAVVTPEILRSRYVRCAVCAPDIPEYSSPQRFVSKAWGSLGAKDIGRLSTLGTIDMVVHIQDAVVVTFSPERVETAKPDERISFPLQRTLR